jgi:ParB family transcriptional regulator, chromosome partitioning protein
VTKGKLHLSFDIASLKGADYNPRRIDAETFDKLRASVRTLGCVKPIIVRGNVIVAGHQRTKAMLAEGITRAPVFALGSDASTYDEVRFNQLHNGTDLDYGGERMRLPSRAPLAPGFYSTTALLQDPGGSARGAKVRNEIMRLITRHGDWGGCVANSNGEIFHAAQYAMSCKTLGTPCLVYVVPDAIEPQARAALGAQYGVFSYDHLPKQTFIQTLAQLNRLSGEERDNCSPTYEELIIPWLAKHPGARVLDFGCGKGDYVSRLSKAGYNIIGVEFFRRAVHTNQIDVAAVNRMVDAVERSLREYGLFDAVISDYVLNSVDSVQAEDDVVTCVAGLCKACGTVWLSGRRREQVDDCLRSEVSVLRRTKRNIEFLDEHGFSGLYRSGRWFYQKFHDKSQVRDLMERHGITITRHNEHHVSWQIEGRTFHRATASTVESAIAREFNMPLNDSGRRLGRAADIIEAYRAALER